MPNLLRSLSLFNRETQKYRSMHQSRAGVIMFILFGWIKYAMIIAPLSRSLKVLCTPIAGILEHFSVFLVFAYLK